MLELYDTAGQEDYRALRDHYIVAGNGFLVVFSLVSSVSFEACKDIYRKICLTKSTKYPAMILVGNKKDIDSKHAVSESEIRDFCVRCRCNYISVSAKTGDNVERAFIELVREMQKRLPVKPKPQFSRRCIII